MERFNTHTLSNGLRIIHMPSPTNVAYCGIAIDAGTRDERDCEHGAAHFCEHMIFKGTHKRKAWHILNRMELVGGDLNAYTNKEETVVYSAFMKGDFSRAVELIADIVFNSTFPQHEMDKEAEVVVDEIKSYLDSPAELIYDEFEHMIFSGHSLGHDILGTPETVRSFKTADLQGFTSRLYVPSNMIFFVFGKIPFSHVVRTVEKYCSGIVPPVPVYLDTDTRGDVFHGNKWRMPLKPYTAEHRTELRGTHQAHVMIGSRAYPSDDKRRIALYFLNNIIAGPGMNSLLNVSLREHNGLVYTVESSLTNYTDTGTFAIYFGCDADDIGRCMKLVRKELDRLTDAPLSESRFKAAMKQIKGQIGVACDNFENYALDMAKCFLHYNRFEGIEDTISHLDQLTPEKVYDVAREILAEENLSVLIYK